MKHRSFLLSLFIALSGCSKKQESIKPQIKTITESVYASGIIKARQQYQVFAKVNGILKTVYVTEGGSVKKGDPLFLIENQTSALNAENARLALKLSAENAGGGSNVLRELEAALSLAAEKLRNDSSMYFRQLNLWKQNVGSKTELEQRELAYKASRSGYLSALSRYRQTRKQLRTDYELARNNFRLNKELESDYTVRSETDGLVYDILKEKGEMVNPQSPIAVLGKTDDFLLELQVDEYDVARLSPGQQVLVTMDSYKGRIFKAQVSKIYPIMNERSRTFKVEAIFTSAPPRLFPNLTLEANIIIQTRKNALVIPRDYLQDSEHVLIEPDKIQQVKTGLMDYQFVEITQGLDTNRLIYKPR